MDLPTANLPLYQLQQPPPAGFRVSLSADASLPSPEQLGRPVCVDADGHSPVYLASAILANSVHPCKVAPHLRQPCRVPYGGGEQKHNGRYDLLPFDHATMEWVPTSHGQIPPGRRPVEGGYEEAGKLYHALALVNGVRVPGKMGHHLGACHVAFGGKEVVVRKNYEILCWR